MTRETKIGMLVGLAFIIVIGILLSDHMTSTTEPPKAALSSAGDEVRRGTTTPAAADAPAAAPVTSQTPTAPAVIVPTREELTQRAAQPPAVQSIQVGAAPGAATANPPITIQQTGQAAPGAVAVGPQPPVGGGTPQVIIQPAQGAQPQPPITVSNGVPIMPTPQGGPVATANAGDELEQWARRGGTGTTVAIEPATTAPPTRTASAREYKAQPGDNLHRIAERQMGASTKANRAAIVKANPSLKKDPNRIIVGRTYIIPVPAAAAAPAAQAPQAVAAPAPADAEAAAFAEATEPVKPWNESRVDTAAAAAPTSPAAPGLDSGQVWYTVQENDNLWKIAADQLGSGNEWQKIKDLNKDILKGGDTVHPNMRLRLPGKNVATAQ